MRICSAVGLMVFLVPFQLYGSHIPGFQISPFFNEQVLVFTFAPEVKITINAPSAATFDPAKPVNLILFTLPNGNSTAWTIGKKLKAGDDWHYDIQHIGAQTRFLRAHVPEVNVVTAYLETNGQSWPAWRAKYVNNAQLICALVDSVRAVFNPYTVRVTLSSHSGGGSFIFGFLNGVDSIPAWIERIAFLDSDYAYDDASHHGDKLAQWLKASDHHYLSVLAYNDSIALYNGQPIVSPTGGTWYRSQLMIKRLQSDFAFSESLTVDFRYFRALGGRIDFILKENPTRAILHTVQVELNGFIQTTLSGTPHEGVGYVYYGARAYGEWIQDELTQPHSFGIQNQGIGSLRILVPGSTTDSCEVSLSSNGVDFETTSILNRGSPIVSAGGISGTAYVRLRAFNGAASSQFTEVLAASTEPSSSQLLIVNGFDRATTGNTYDFVRQHAGALAGSGLQIASATNEAILDGTVHLRDYGIVDWILGEESTVDETFSSAEQESVKAYLRSGGRLLVSGSEIAWDLDYKGSNADRDFCRQFLKAQYLADAPNGAAGTVFASTPSAFGILSGGGTMTFDNGAHGTYAVMYPDVFTPVNGGSTCLSYSGAPGAAGVSYDGTVPGGSSPAKLVTLGIPFETLYPDTARSWLMRRVLDFFDAPTAVARENARQPAGWELGQNYPNPFNGMTRIPFSLGAASHVKLTLFDALGRRVETVIEGDYSAGTHEATFDASEFASGMYFFRLEAENFTQARSMILIR